MAADSGGRGTVKTKRGFRTPTKSAAAKRATALEGAMTRGVGGRRVDRMPDAPFADVPF